MKLIQLLATCVVLTLSLSVQAREYNPVVKIKCKGGPSRVDLTITKFDNGDVSYCVTWNGEGAEHCNGIDMNGWEINKETTKLIATSAVENNTYKALFSYQTPDGWKGDGLHSEPVKCVIKQVAN